MLTFIIFSFLAGLHRALWGAYKDSPYEPFKISKSVRSICLSVVWGIILYLIFPLLAVQRETFSPAYIFLMTVSLDTISTEFYKLFIRTEPQEKYAIPSMFHVWNKKVSNFQRLIICLSLSLFLLSIMYVLSQIKISSIIISPTPFGAPSGIYSGIMIVYLHHIGAVLVQSAMQGGAIGIIGGILEATGGMWKDAPFEGFELLKFFRSPLVGLFWGTLLSINQPNLAVLFLSILGANRMTIELYKTFIKKRKVGKFKADQPIFPQWLAKRNIFTLPYMATWTIFVIYLLWPFQH